MPHKHLSFALTPAPTTESNRGCALEQQGSSQSGSTSWAGRSMPSVCPSITYVAQATPQSVCGRVCQNFHDSFLKIWLSVGHALRSCTRCVHIWILTLALTSGYSLRPSHLDTHSGPRGCYCSVNVDGSFSFFPYQFYFSLHMYGLCGLQACLCTVCVVGAEEARKAHGNLWKWSCRQS